MGAYASADGAQNVSSYHEKVRRGYLPSPDSITFEGLLSQYFFKTGCDETEELVHTTYSIAQCPNFVTGEIDRYIGVGLNSSEDGKNYRAPLNLVVVLDISGSMGSSFVPRRAPSAEDAEFSAAAVDSSRRRSKMDIAKEVLVDLLRILTPKERLGIVLFDTVVEILQPFRDVPLIDIDELAERIQRDVRPRGGTNMEIALRAAVEMLKDHSSSQDGTTSTPTGASNYRIVFLTDAQPNAGGGPDDLVGLTQSASTDHHIYTTFIGIGLDFNSSLTDQLTKVRGANYFSVHSRREFQRILNEDFNYVVTELAHDVSVTLESDAFAIDKVFGTPYPVSGNQIRIGTICASAVDPRGCKGGLLLVKLARVVSEEAERSGDDDDDEEGEEGRKELIEMVLKYVLPNSAEDEEEERIVCQIDFDSRIERLVEEGKIFEHPGIRKAVLLAQYGTIIRGILREAQVNRLEWISDEDIETLKRFKQFYEAEAAVLGDKSLIQELDTIDRLIYRKKSDVSSQPRPVRVHVPVAPLRSSRTPARDQTWKDFDHQFPWENKLVHQWTDKDIDAFFRYAGLGSVVSKLLVAHNIDNAGKLLALRNEGRQSSKEFFSSLASEIASVAASKTTDATSNVCCIAPTFEDLPLPPHPELYFRTLLEMLRLPKAKRQTFPTRFVRVLRKLIRMEKIEEYVPEELALNVVELADPEMIKSSSFLEIPQGVAGRSRSGFKCRLVVTETTFSGDEQFLRRVVSPMMPRGTKQTGVFHLAILVGPWYLDWGENGLVVPKGLINDLSGLMGLDIPAFAFASPICQDLRDVQEAIAPAVAGWNANLGYGKSTDPDARTANSFSFVTDILHVLGIEFRPEGSARSFFALMRKEGVCEMAIRPTRKFARHFRLDQVEFMRDSRINVKTTTTTLPEDSDSDDDEDWDLLPDDEKPGPYRIVFRTHDFLDRFWHYCITLDPLAFIDFPHVHSILKCFDRAFWLRHLKSPEDPRFQPAPVSEEMLYGEEKMTGCPFLHPNDRGL